MTCRECSEFLADYVGDELPEEQLAIFERHLNACPNCVEYMRQYKATILAGRVACVDPEAEADLPEPIIQAILAARRGLTS